MTNDTIIDITQASPNSATKSINYSYNLTSQITGINGRVQAKRARLCASEMGTVVVKKVREIFYNNLFKNYILTL
jgi:hypothetical protein